MGLRDSGLDSTDPTQHAAWVQGGEGYWYRDLGVEVGATVGGIAHEPLFHEFLDARKVYNSLDKGWCMEILRGYGMGQNMARLISHH